MKFKYKDKVKVANGFYKDMVGYVIDRDERSIVIQGTMGGPYYEWVEWYRVGFINDGHSPWIKGADIEITD